MSNLSSLISFSSATQGEKNYVTNPSGSSNTTGWAVVAGTGATTQATIAVVRSTTASELPRATSTGTGLKFTSTAASGGTPVTAFAYTTFKLDAADLGKKLKVQFEMAPVSGYTASDYSIEVRASATAFTSPNRTSGTLLALSTDSSSVTSLPNATGTFRTTFDTQSALPYIAVYLVPKTTVAVSLVVSDFVVGPGVVTQGAAVSLMTPAITFSNATGLTWDTSTLSFQRVGEYLLIDGYMQVTAGDGSSGSTLTMALSGLTPVQGQTGSVRVEQFTTGYAFDYLAYAGGGVIQFYSQNVASTASVAQSGASFGLVTSGRIRTVYFSSCMFRIAEWAGSGVVNVAQNDIQYYYGTGGTWGTSATITTAQGPGGVLGGTTTPASSNFAWTFTPTYPIPVGAKPTLSFSIDGVHFYPAGGSQPGGFLVENLRYDGTNIIGASVATNSSGQIVVTFGKYAAGTSSTWNTPWYWRVEVGLPGQAVGFAAATNTVRGLALDQRQYVVGTAYTNGTPTITCGQAGFAVTRGVLVPYQTSDGAWRMRLNVAASFTSASNGGLTLTFLGVTFKSVANFYQTVAASEIGNANAIHVQSYANPGLSTISTSLQTAVTYSGVMLSGDVELDSKPTWAD